VQAGTLSDRIAPFAAVFLVILSGVKIIDDAQDYEYDRSIEKRTVAVVLGRGRAVELAYYVMFLGLLGTLWLTVDGIFPPTAFLAAVAFGAVAVIAYDSGPRIATMLLVRGSYLFLAALIAAVAFEPLVGAPLPDIGVLGPYTYLATEVVFGSIGFALLYRADALGDYVRALVFVYPIAYVWDWYTLEVGVFEIPLRTDWELFGIPIEEHLFMLVVPALVIGLYETVRRGDDEGGRLIERPGSD
jgi:lycopene cyclase domain-containing protein